MPWEKQFDKDEALDRAMRAFWTGGYEGTSMTDLLDQMGIQKGSFYATFGCKHQVLMDALAAYSCDRFSGFAELSRDPSPRHALERHLSDVAADATGANGSLGCFVVNTALELAPRDEEVRGVVQSALEAHEEHYRKLLAAAKAKGEVPADLDPEAVARGLLALVLGIRVLARSAVPREVIESVRDQALALLGTRRSRRQ